MIRNLKVLGFALVAVLAFSAMTASAASALPGKLTADGPVTLDATEMGTNRLITSKGSIECPGTVITGHNYLTQAQTETGDKHGFIASGAETVTLTGDFPKHCKAKEPSGTEHFATVTPNGCDFVGHIGETTGTVNEYLFPVDIECPPGKVIAVTIYLSNAVTNENVLICTNTIGTQTGLTGLKVTTNTAQDDLEIQGIVTNIAVTREGACGAANEIAEQEINATVKGTNEAGGNTGITVTDAG